MGPSCSCCTEGCTWGEVPGRPAPGVGCKLGAAGPACTARQAVQLVTWPVQTLWLLPQ